MEFKDSGLPQTKLIEEAFNFSKANAMSNEKDAMKEFKQQIDMIFAQREMMLDLQKNDMGMPEADYEREKKKLEKAREEQMRIGPQAIRQELNNMFVNRRVGLAKEVQAHTENPTEELIAAVMLYVVTAYTTNVARVKLAEDFSADPQKLKDFFAGKSVTD